MMIISRSLIFLCLLLLTVACCQNEGERLPNPTAFFHSSADSVILSERYSDITAATPGGDNRPITRSDSSSTVLYLSPNHDTTFFYFSGPQHEDTLIFAYEREIGHNEQLCGMEMHFKNLEIWHHTFEDAYINWTSGLYWRQPEVFIKID